MIGAAEHLLLKTTDPKMSTAESVFFQFVYGASIFVKMIFKITFRFIFSETKQVKKISYKILVKKLRDRKYVKKIRLRQPLFV